MTQDATKFDALRRFEHDDTIRALLEEATTFEGMTSDLLSYIESGRLVISRGTNAESRETIGESVQLAKLALEGRYRTCHERQADGSFLIGSVMLPGR